MSDKMTREQKEHFILGYETAIKHLLDHGVKGQFLTELNKSLSDGKLTETIDGIGKCGIGWHWDDNLQCCVPD